MQVQIVYEEHLVQPLISRVFTPKRTTGSVNVKFI